MAETRAAVQERVAVAALDEWMERIGLWASLLAAAIAVVALAGDLWQIVFGHTFADWQRTVLQIAAIVGVALGVVGTVASWYHYLRLAYRFVIHRIRPNLQAEAKAFAQDNALNLPDTADNYVRRHARELRGCRARGQPPAAVGVLAGVVLVAVLTVRSTPSSAASLTFRQVTPFPISSHAYAYLGMVVDSQNNLWFVGQDEQQIVRIAPNGTTKVFMPSHATSQISSLALGPDGSVWFGENGYAINDPSTGSLLYDGAVGRLAPDGTLTEFPLPLADVDKQYGSGATDLILGPSGDLWYVVTGGPSYQSTIERITPDGVISAGLPLAGLQPASAVIYGLLSFGPDGNLWLPTHNAQQITRLTPSGVAKSFPVPGLAGTHAFIYDLTTGRDGALWFTIWYTPGLGASGRIGRITTDGNITLFPLPSTLDPQYVATAPNGVLWVSAFATANGKTTASAMLRVAPSGAITRYPLPGDGAHPGITPQAQRFAFGPDGTLWVDAVFGTSNFAPQEMYKISI